MQLPIEVSYRGVAKSDEIETLVREKASRLDKFCDHISRCDVVIEQPNHAQHSGSPFRVRIDVTVPPAPRTRRRRETDQARDARAAEKSHRRRVQAHGAPTQGIDGSAASEGQGPRTTTARTRWCPSCSPADGYGFITDLQGRDVYFPSRQPQVNGDFEKLKVGTEVRFDETNRRKGRARHERPCGQHRRLAALS